jgi:hypothetical protein
MNSRLSLHRHLVGRFLPALAILFLLSGCVATRQEPLPTYTPIPTLPPTATIDWFPVTATPTREPTRTVQPTPDQRPAIGSIRLRDDFSRNDTWQVIENSQGSAAFGKNDVTIAISKPGGYIASLNKDAMLTDFYLEITMKPSLCRGDDAYGLLFRAASTLDNYRLLVNCNGSLRLERMIAGKPAPLRDWEPSGQVPPGSPLEIRVGVWAVRNELRFFINDFYQFSARDPVHTAGGIGVFARSGGKNALTVSFSELEVRGIIQDQVPTFAPPTPRPTFTPYR